jgi:biotin synthase
MKYSEQFEHYTQHVINGDRLGAAEALKVLATPPDAVYSLLASAHEVRRHFRGDHVDLCGIVNVKSGACPEDCAFCAQSAHHDTDAPVYPVMAVDRILEHARAAKGTGANRFSLVSSGPGVADVAEFDRICEAVSAITRKTGLGRCVSLGALNREQLGQLKSAGLERVHHNIETAESFFDEICSTHTYADRIDTIRTAKEAGFFVCSGVLCGMGESPEQRVEMALALSELEVNSVPLNFLNPIPGTPLEHTEPLHPLEILKIIAMFRFMLPDREIRMCGGRERNLRTVQPLMYAAGADGVMIGNYLTTPGRAAGEDIEMIQDMGLRTGSMT